VDTLELVKRLERSGLDRAQAEEMSSHLCAVLSGTLERLHAKFSTKAEAEGQAFLHDSAFGLFKAETKMLLDQRQAVATRDFDQMKSEVDKLRADCKYEMEKLTAGQRLDLNLEKGRIRDELLTQSQKAIQTEIRLVR